jgi:predicted AAA+ superfamily ATPase
MWIERDFKLTQPGGLPIKVLQGPRQVGKTSLLAKESNYEIAYLDDPALRDAVQRDPKTFLDHKPNKLVLDEAALAPNLFSELKRRSDEKRRMGQIDFEYWLTGSTQTLMRKNVGESLAGRASFYELNTLSVHELGTLNLENQCLRGGWPHLRSNPNLDSVRYLNDLITTFVERDIALTAGIEKMAAFQKVLHLNAGRVGELYVASEVSKAASVDVTTVQSWNQLLQHNSLIELVQPFSTNLNKRLIKAPKMYFQDVSLAVRLQGWSEFSPLYVSPYMGHVYENLVFSELSRCFVNRGLISRIFHLRSKERVEIHFLVELPNQRYIAVEAKMTPEDFSTEQIKLIESLRINVVAKWMVSLKPDIPIPRAQNLSIEHLWDKLGVVLAGYV